MSNVKKSNVFRPCGRFLSAAKTADQKLRSIKQSARRVNGLLTFDFLTFDSSF